MTGQSASAVCNLVTTSVRTPVKPMWSCGDVLGSVGRLVSVQRREQTNARLSERREIGDAVTCGDLNATAWREAKTLLQLSAMVANVSTMACFALPFFVVFSSSVSTSPSLLSSSSPLASSPSFAHYVMEQAITFRISPVSDSLLRITESVSNGRRRTALRGV